MNDFEKTLTLIIKKSEWGTITVTMNDIGVPESAVRRLTAKELVKIQPAADDDFFIVLTDKGINYFDEKREKLINSIRSRSLDFVLGLMEWEPKIKKLTLSLMNKKKKT